MPANKDLTQPLVGDDQPHAYIEMNAPGTQQPAPEPKADWIRPWPLTGVVLFLVNAALIVGVTILGTKLADRSQCVSYPVHGLHNIIWPTGPTGPDLVSTSSPGQSYEQCYRALPECCPSQPPPEPELAQKVQRSCARENGEYPLFDQAWLTDPAYGRKVENWCLRAYPNCCETWREGCNANL